MPVLLGAIISSNQQARADTGAIFSLGTVRLTSTASYIEFTSIPQTYKHLQLRFLTAATDGYTDGYIAFNGDTTSTNYYANRIFGNGNATGNTAQNTNYNFIQVPEI